MDAAGPFMVGNSSGTRAFVVDRGQLTLMRIVFPRDGGGAHGENAGAGRGGTKRVRVDSASVIDIKGYCLEARFLPPLLGVAGLCVVEHEGGGRSIMVVRELVKVPGEPPRTEAFPIDGQHPLRDDDWFGLRVARDDVIFGAMTSRSIEIFELIMERDRRSARPVRRYRMRLFTPRFFEFTSAELSADRGVFSLWRAVEEGSECLVACKTLLSSVDMDPRIVNGVDPRTLRDATTCEAQPDRVAMLTEQEVVIFTTGKDGPIVARFHHAIARPERIEWSSEGVRIAIQAAPNWIEVFDEWAQPSRERGGWRKLDEAIDTCG